jgi:hypothetical protein
MKRMLLVACMLGCASVSRADDVTTGNGSPVIIINGPVIVKGNGNIVQIGNGNKVIVQNGGKMPGKTPAQPRTVPVKGCDLEAQRNEAQVAAWLAMMGKK